MTAFFASGPTSLPMNRRGGNVIPTAISIVAAQCASICAALIFPHSRSLSGLSNASRSFASFRVAAAKRSFIGSTPVLSSLQSFCYSSLSPGHQTNLADILQL